MTAGQARRDEERVSIWCRRGQPVVDASIFNDALRVVAGHAHALSVAADAPGRPSARGLGEAPSPKLAEARDDVVDVAQSGGRRRRAAPRAGAQDVPQVAAVGAAARGEAG